jgi:hypothetical protein
MSLFLDQYKPLKVGALFKNKKSGQSESMKIICRK